MFLTVAACAGSFCPGSLSLASSQEPGLDGNLGLMGAWAGWEAGLDGSLGWMGAWQASTRPHPHLPTPLPPGPGLGIDCLLACVRAVTHLWDLESCPELQPQSLISFL